MSSRPGRRYSVLFLTLLFAAGTARAQDASPDAVVARAFLEQTAERYHQLESYYFAGTISVEMTTANGRQALDLDLVVAEQRPDLFRADLRSSALSMTALVTADSTIIYLPDAHRYIREPGRLPIQNAESPLPDLLGEYQQLADGVASVTFAGADTLVVGGEARPTLVLAVAYTPAPSPAGADSSHRTVWIDRERLLVLQDQTRAYMADSPLGGSVTIHEHTLFSDVRADVPLPDSLFTFAPPATAEAVPLDALTGASATASTRLEGKPAPDFALPNLAGETVRLRDLEGRVVLLNLWATWCGPCRIEMPAIEELHQTFADDGLTVLAVNIGETPEEVQAYIDRFDYTFPVLLDADATVGDRYHAFSIPSTVVIGRDGVVSHHLVGARPEAVFREALRTHGLGAERNAED